MTSYLIVFAVTCAVSALLVLTQGWHDHFSMDKTEGVQKHHENPTPRIGGIAILAGVVAGWALTSGEIHHILATMVWAGIPAFAAGLAEDTSKRIGVMPRLLATMFSGALAWRLTSIAMQNTGVPLLDSMLQYLPFAVAFTAFAVGGVTNSFNIIDGFNGLACGASAIMLIAMSLIAYNVGDADLGAVCLFVAACALGFGVLNWPLGKIFLGDGGAYLLGFMVAWIAVLLPMRNPHINGWATLLACAYPVIEVAYSLRRRQKRVGQHAGHPDKAHLHHFLHRRVVRPLFPRLSPTLQNGLTSPLCWACAALPASLAVVFADDTSALVVSFGVMAFAYGAVYARLTQFRWCFSAYTLRPSVASS